MKPENNTNPDFCVCCGEPVSGRPHGLHFLRNESETDYSIQTEQTGEEIKETIWLFEGAQK